jgi:hypothetical protein
MTPKSEGAKTAITARKCEIRNLRCTWEGGEWPVFEARCTVYVDENGTALVMEHCVRKPIPNEWPDDLRAITMVETVDRLMRTATRSVLLLDGKPLEES